jgi:hypothetical protein
MGFAAEFFRAMEVARRPVLEASVRAFVSMPARSFVPRWYLMLYQIIRATTPTLRHAALALNVPTGGFELDLEQFFHAKDREEAGHDRLLLADLVRVGVSERLAFLAPVNPWVAEMVGRQSYLIDFVHPVAYLGFIGLLEGFPPSLEQIDAIQAASGFPAEAFSCARLHAKADVGHREELARVLDVVPSNLRTAILSNGLRCAALQVAALEHLSLQESSHG